MIRDYSWIVDLFACGIGSTTYNALKKKKEKKKKHRNGNHLRRLEDEILGIFYAPPPSPTQKKIAIKFNRTWKYIGHIINFEPSTITSFNRAWLAIVIHKSMLKWFIGFTPKVKSIAIKKKKKKVMFWNFIDLVSLYL